MKITPIGAAGGEVTGSCYVVQTRDASIMVDCGLFQGSRKSENYNKLPAKKDLDKLHSVVLTHAHLDHTGRLPLLTRFGYKKPIYATPATIDLTDIILRDAAYLQLEDVKRQNRRLEAEGKPLLEPLYGSNDIQRLAGLFRPMKVDKPVEVAPGMTVRAVESGHILGSVSLELTVNDAGTKKVIVFSGDLGPRGAPLHRDPTPFKHADAVFMESTYGDKDHPSLAETAVAAREAISEAIRNKGRVLVPCFAIGRTQLLLYLLAGAFKRKTLPTFPIFVDSPMAISATTIYQKHRELFDEEALSMAHSGELASTLRSVKLVAKATESRKLATRPGPFLVMAGAGMCTGGRILHHMANHLSDPTTLLLMVGYQGDGSLGRRIADGSPTVKIMGRVIPVKARVHIFSGLSGHAGQSDLVKWFESLASSRPRLYLTHGEDGPRETLRDVVAKRTGIQAQLANYREPIEL